jgi:hypothetical protein
MTGIKGVTYPIPKKFMNRFFDGGKTIFIKPATCFKEIKPGMKFVFYQSKEDTGFIGEAEINSITFAEDPLVFMDQYGEKVFLTPKELTDYQEDQKRWKHVRVRKAPPKKRMWMAIELRNIQLYSQIKKGAQFIAVGGQYLRD